jgi:hypothetical protein
MVANSDLRPDTLIILNPRWKIEDGKEVLDLEETAKASVVITGIGGVNGGH